LRRWHRIDQETQAPFLRHTKEEVGVVRAIATPPGTSLVSTAWPKT
jgi:hypothetical protein